MDAPEVIEFAVDRPDAVVAAMRELAAAGGGWINLQPAVDADDLDGGGGVFRIFSARGPQVPLCTWTPPEQRRHGPAMMSLGIQHGAGSRLLPLLVEIGIAVPEGWRVLQDQSRKGLVLAVPDDAGVDGCLSWLLTAGEAVCRVRHDGWVAAVHRPRR